MRHLILCVSALSLSACSMGGLGFGSGQTTGPYAGYDAHASAGYGSWQTGYSDAVSDTGYYGHAASACAAAYTPPQQPTPCSQPPFVPPVQPCYQPQPQPCAVPTPQPCYQPRPQPCAAPAPQPYPYGYQHTSTSVSYPNGYPDMSYPAPSMPAPHGCAASTCSSSYSVSPYGADYNVDPANPYAYGHDASYNTASYGHSNYAAPALRPAPHYYGTLGAVWYDLDNPYAGLQARLGYQSASYFGAEVEGSIGVINEVSPFNQPPLSGEFKDGVEYSAAAFATARLPLSRNISTHARLGYHTMKRYAEVNFDNNPDQKVTQTYDGVAYGAGLQMDVTPVDAVRLDYTRYEDDLDGSDSVSLAYLRRF